LVRLLQRLRHRLLVRRLVLIGREVVGLLLTGLLRRVLRPLHRPLLILVHRDVYRVLFEDVIDLYVPVVFGVLGLLQILRVVYFFDELPVPRLLLLLGLLLVSILVLFIFTVRLLFLWDRLDVDLWDRLGHFRLCGSVRLV
jgi:hypothetical protein